MLSGLSRTQKKSAPIGTPPELRPAHSIKQEKNVTKHPVHKKQVSGSKDKEKAVKAPPPHPHGIHRPPHKASAQAVAPLVMPELVDVPPEEGKTRFIELDLAKEILCAVQDLKFRYCTPIQQKCLPAALEGRDVTGKAQTGTGKTAAFLAAAFTTLLRKPKENRKPGSCRVLVLAPTRELAIQIHKDAEALGKYGNFNNLVIFGGMGHKEQRAALQKPIDVLVGTPGRILDYMSTQHLNLSDVEILVIDEADRMLDMGFIPDVRRIVSRTPRPGKRQTMFFSATLTPEILRLVNSWLLDPVTVEVAPEQVVATTIEQRFYAVSKNDKFAFLHWLLNNDQATRMLVFGNRKDSTFRLTQNLRRYGIRSELLSGDIPQEKRLKILERFRSGQTPVLVATDVAARGIHVDNVSHVINYDLPERPEDYVHRIGRTGRAGMSGKAISFVCEFGAYSLEGIEELIEQQIKCLHPEENMLHLPPPPPESEINRDGLDPQRHSRPRHPEHRGDRHHSGGGRRPGSKRY